MSVVVRALRAALFAAALLSSCAPSRTTVDLRTRVAVTITPAPDVLPFDPRAARISSATAQLAEVAGHYIALDVDAAMVPEHRSRFEEALGEAFENMARDLAELRKSEPEIFAYGVPLVERVSLRYDATLTRDDSSLDLATHTLTIRGPARTDALVRQWSLHHALGLAYGKHAMERFASVAPSAIPAEERRAYFRFLTSSLPGRGFPDDHEAKTARDLASSPRATRVLAVLRLAEVAAGDAELSRDIQRWLVMADGYFVSPYVHTPALVRALPQDCEWKRAETAYAKWLVATYPRLEEPDRIALLHSVFVRSFTTERAADGGRSYPSFAWPTIDRYAFGLRIIDEWRKAGHPTPMSSPRVSSEQELIACPNALDREYHVAPRCEYDWYRFALETDEGRKRLATSLLERNDPKLTATTFENVRSAISDHPLETSVALLRAVEKSDVVWSAGMRVLASQTIAAGDAFLLEEAQRLWRERPSGRGLVLLVVAQLDQYDNGNVDWRGFGDAFGTKVSAAELDSYLSEGPTAMALVPVVWPALGKGYSRAASIVPRLDAYLADTSHEGGQRQYGTLSRIIGRMCAEKNQEDLAAMRAYLQRRITTHPGEPYAALADEALSTRCKVAPPAPPPKKLARPPLFKKDPR